jgi:lysophospholipase L1-like esterase
VRPAAAAEPADVAAPRADANSQRAHEQLLAKARQSGIDVYFVGDSITRRWGASDPLYADLLANWQKNFFGWNAGNFGWGGDRTENILWRLENGEIDDVHPKVIVVLAGTNNIDPAATSVESVASQAAEIGRGIEAIVAACRRKAPKATIILTAVFPRNDVAAAMPIIDAVNAHIAKLTDGERIRFLDVNERLLDADGKLRRGMMQDGLHPTVAGYQAWADGLKPILTELLGPPADDDHAPPPTGDPSLSSQAPTGR